MKKSDIAVGAALAIVTVPAKLSTKIYAMLEHVPMLFAYTSGRQAAQAVVMFHQGKRLTK
jgi:hypothetical protein